MAADELREKCARRVAGLSEIVKRLRNTGNPDDLADAAFLLGSLSDISDYVDYLRASQPRAVSVQTLTGDEAAAALAARISELDAMLKASEEHTEHWESAAAAAIRERDEARKVLEEVATAFTAWSEDWNDGTYAYWKSDDLMVACAHAQSVLASLAEQEKP
jgi:hypothetical protein